MTIPEPPGAGPDASADPGAPRATRPEPPRQGPVRGGYAPHPSTNDGGSDRGAGSSQNLSEDIAQTVRVGYDVFTKNLELGRQAASDFSHGQYDIRRVPETAGMAAHELIRLLRQLSETAFDICDRLAQQMAQPPAGKPPDPAPVPPFRAAAPNGAPPPGPAPQPQTVALTVRFAGPVAGRALVNSLDRPQAPTSPADIRATPLLPRDETAVPITGVTFEYDVASGGLAASVTVPAGQASGVYSGVVWAATQDTPLGALAIELDQ